MTIKEAKKMEQLLKDIPPRYDYYKDDFRLVDDEEWHKMAVAVTILREMYFKKKT